MGCGLPRCGCSPVGQPCGCGGPCRCRSGGCNSATGLSLPFYVTAEPIQQGHCREIVTNKFSAAVCSASEWTIPNCNSTATLTLLDVIEVPIGSYIWHSSYGYFLVQSYDRLTGQLTIQNTCIQGNAAPGTEVPECTCFVVAPPPCPDDSLIIPYVALDFTAPENAECTIITVTTTEGLTEGSQINISIGTYLLDEIISATTIRICNEGSGIPGGTLVVAIGPGGGYQYPITTVTGNLIASDSDQQVDASMAATDTLTSSTQLVIVNPSASRSMNVMYSLNAWTNGSTDNADTIPWQSTLQFDVDINGGGAATVATIGDSVNNFDADAYLYSQSLDFDNFYIIPPSGTVTIDVDAILTSVNAVGPTYINVTLDSRITAIGVLA